MRLKTKIKSALFWPCVAGAFFLGGHPEYLDIAKQNFNEYVLPPVKSFFNQACEEGKEELYRTVKEFRENSENRRTNKSI